MLIRYLECWSVNKEATLYLYKVIYSANILRWSFSLYFLASQIHDRELRQSLVWKWGHWLLDTASATADHLCNSAHQMWSQHSSPDSEISVYWPLVHTDPPTVEQSYTQVYKMATDRNWLSCCALNRITLCKCIYLGNLSAVGFVILLVGVRDEIRDLWVGITAHTKWHGDCHPHRVPQTRQLFQPNSSVGVLNEVEDFNSIKLIASKA